MASSSYFFGQSSQTKTTTRTTEVASSSSTAGVARSRRTPHAGAGLVAGMAGSLAVDVAVVGDRQLAGRQPAPARRVRPHLDDGPRLHPVVFHHRLEADHVLARHELSVPLPVEQRTFFVLKEADVA